MATLVDDATPAPVVLTPRRCRVAHAWLHENQYRSLALEAERLGMHPDELAAKVLSSLISHDLLVEALSP